MSKPPGQDTPPVIVAQLPAGQDVNELVGLIQKVILGAMKGDGASPEDRALVARHLAPQAELTFVGRRLAALDEIGKFNATRYKWVRKQIDRWDVTHEGATTIVTSLGSLYGEWPDGTAFQGNRYLDRFVLVDGRITQMDVWNDSAELLLLRAGLVEG
jgi:hypothetical protein